MSPGFSDFLVKTALKSRQGIFSHKENIPRATTRRFQVRESHNKFVISF